MTAANGSPATPARAHSSGSSPDRTGPGVRASAATRHSRRTAAARPPQRGFVKIAVLALVFLFGVIFAGAFNAGLAYTNRMEFCVSCHTMQTNYEEYKESLHYKNQSGVQATCADCHVPKEFVPKMITKVVAAKDVYHEIIGTIDTPEKFEAHRWDMASRVWDKMRRSNSRECRTCHDLANMDLSEQGRSARSRHARAEEKGQTCIDCHSGIVHEEPLGPPPSDPPREPSTAAGHGIGADSAGASGNG